MSEKPFHPESNEPPPPYYGGTSQPGQQYQPPPAGAYAAGKEKYHFTIQLNIYCKNFLGYVLQRNHHLQRPLLLSHLTLFF